MKLFPDVRGYSSLIIQPTRETALVDPLDRPIFEGGLTIEDILDAAESAVRADDYPLARELMKRHGLHICLQCKKPLRETAVEPFCNYVCRSDYVHERGSL